jgi:hypothetical protein
VGAAVVRDAWTLSQKRKGTQVLRQTQPGTGAEGCRMTRLASSRTGENLPYGMNQGGAGTVGTTCWPFAMMPERADTAEAIALNRRASALLDHLIYFGLILAVFVIRMCGSLAYPNLLSDDCRNLTVGEVVSQ